MLIPMGFLAASGAGATPAYELISTTTADGSSATLTLSSIPTGYKHLQIRAVLKSNRNSTDDPINITLNGNTSNGSYTYHTLGMLGNTALASQDFVSGHGAARYAGYVAGNSSGMPTGIFSAHIIDILDYTASKYKVLRGMFGFGNGTSGTNWIQLNSKLFYSSSAVNSVSLSIVAGTAFIAGSRISIYGIKG